jgi:hypothetical protein
MPLKQLYNRFRDFKNSAHGPRLLVSSFTTLFWHFPQTGESRVIHNSAGKYYGIGLADNPHEFLAISRPDQECDDLLLKINHLTGAVSQTWQLTSRDTHQAIRHGDRLLVTDSFRGRLLEYSLPEVALVRSYDVLNYEAHLNTIRVFEGNYYLLAHNFGESALHRLDPQSGEIQETWAEFGLGSHDVTPWEDSFLTVDSLHGGLLRVNRCTQQTRMLWCEEGKFTKGLCVEGGIAYFGVSPPSQREMRYQVICELVAFDLLNERLLWRRPMPFPGLINAVTTPQQLAREKRGEELSLRRAA